MRLTGSPCIIWLVAVALVAGSLLSLPSWAQTSIDGTTLLRAIQLVDAARERARAESDPMVKARLLEEADAADLFLPLTDRQVAAARRLSQRLSSMSLPSELSDHIRIEAWLERAAEIYMRNEGVPYSDYDLPIVQRAREMLGRGDERAAASVISAAGALRGSIVERLCDSRWIGFIQQTIEGWTDHLDRMKGIETLTFLGAADLAEAEVRRLSQAPSGSSSIRSVSTLYALVRLAVLQSRAGDMSFAQRIAEEFLSIDAGRGLIQGGSSELGRYGRCEWKLPNHEFDWGMRLLRFQTQSKPRIEPPQSESRLLISWLAEALAASRDQRSLELIRRLAAVVEEGIQRIGVGPLEMALLSARSGVTSIEALDRYRLAKPLYEARSAVALAEFAAGGEFDEARITSLDVDTMLRRLFEQPRSILAERLVKADASLRRVLHKDQDSVKLIFAAAVLYGDIEIAREVRQRSAGRGLSGRVSLFSAIEALEATGLRRRANAATDAYVGTVNASLEVANLHRGQGRSEAEKATLRAIVAHGWDLFVAATLLRDIGERVDILGLARTGDPQQVRTPIEMWMDALDALAWLGSWDELESGLQSPPIELSRLPIKDRQALILNAQGLLAIALARAGHLERALALVSDRSFDQRDYYDERYGYRSSRPVFDLPFLTQEWVTRGHAAR